MNIFSINIFRPIWVFTIAFILSTVHADNGDVRVVCYYTNWSVYRPGTAKFTPQNINPYLCTHLIYAFGGFTKENQLRPFDKYQDIEKGGYAKFTGLKTYNKKLKTLLAVGGWNEGSTRFSPLVASADRRAQFVRNAVKFLRINHFDGLDLDWEYPAYRDGGKPRDRDNYAQLVQELRQEFERESEKTGRPRLLLTMAVPAGIEYIDKGYDIPKLNRYLDWMNILSYDYHSAFEPSVNHHAPLYPLEEDNEYNYDVDLNIDHTIKHYLESGADRDKLVLGIPTYGRSYTLLNPDATEIGSPADGPGEMGDATREKGYLAYYEICERLKSSPNEWEVVHPNARAMGPYTFSDTQWVGYDDAEAVRRKAEYVAEHRLGGIMFWALDNDDFRGNCHDRPYPLIEAAKEALLQSLGTSDNQISSVSRSKTRSRSRNRQTSSNAIGRTINSGGRQGYNSRNQNKVDDEEEERPSSRRRTPAVSAQEDTRKRGGNKRRPSGRRTTTTTTTTTPKSVATPAYNTPEPPTTPDPGSDFKCEEEGFYPHPRDCKKYFWCLSSGPSDLGIVAHQFTCPSGLYFNKAADSCDYTRNVLCNKKKTTTTTTTTTSTTPPSTTTPARTTARAPPRITAATSRTTFRYSATSTTEAPEEDYEYDDDEIESNRDDDNLFDSEEDPRVIKELIDLIKKVGGIEELEKQLQLQEQGISSTGSSSVNTTPPTISRSLYERVLNGRATSKLVSFTSKPSLRQSSNVKYSSINRNSRPGPQNEGLESTVEVQSKPQYVTISRSRPQSPDPSPEDEAKLEAEEISSRQRYEPAQKPQYVTIRRPKIPSENLEEVSSPLPNQQEIDDISNESDDDITTKTVRATATPEYVTIRRTRPSTEETSTSRYTNIQRSRGTTTETAETSPIVTEISDPSTLLTDITSPSTKYTSVTPVFERTSTEAKEYLNVAIQSPVSLSQPENFDTSTIIDDLLKPLLNVAEVETTVGVEITTPTESATPSTSDITRTTPVLLQPRPFAFNKRTRPSSVKSTTTETNDVKSTTDKVSLRAGSGDFNAVRLRKPGVGLGTRLAGSNFEETDENDVISSTNGRRGNSRFRVPNGSLTNQIPAEVQYTAINRARPAQNIDESEVSEETPRYRPRQTIVRRRPYQNNDQVRNIETNSDPIVSRTQTGNQRKYIRRRPIENPEEQEEVFDNVETERPVRRNRPNYNQQRTNNNEAPQQQKERKYRPTSGFDDLSSLTAVDFELQRGKKFGGNSRRIYPTRQRTSTQNVQQTSPVTFESTTVDARTSYKRPTPRTYTEEYFDITNRNDNRFPVSDSDVLTADDLTTDEPDMTTKIYKTLVAKFAIGGNNNRVQERKSPNGYRILPNSHPVFSSSTPYQPITEGLSEEDSEHISVLVDEHYDDFKTSTLTPSPSTITTETTRTTKTRRFPTRRYGNRNSIETNTNDITKNQRTTSRGGSRSLYNPRGTRVEDENVLEEKNDTKIETVRRRRPTNRGKPFIENGRNILDETKTADNEDDETISKTTINNITDLDDENVTDNIKQTSETTISTPRKRVVLRIPKRRTTTTTEQINSEEDLITTKVTNEPTVSTTPSSNRKRIIIKKKRTKPVSTTVSLDEISSTSTESLDDYKLTSEIDRMDIKKETSAETSKYESVTESTTIESEINENENSTELGILEKETIQQNETETTTSSTAKSTESTTKPIRKITRRPGSYRPRRPFTTGSSTTESIVSTRRRPYGRRPGGFRQTSTLRTTESNEGFSRASFRPSFTRPSTVRTPIEEEVIEKNKNLDLEINKENNDDDDDDDENSNDDDNNDESNIEVEDKEVEDKQVEDKDIEDKEDEKLDDSNDNDEEDALEETPDYEIDLEVETSKSTPRPSTPTRVINRPYFKSSGQTTTTRRYQPRFKTNKPTTESPSSRFSGINRPDNSRKQTLFTPRRKNIPVGASSTTSTEKPTSEEDSTTPGTTDQTTSSLLYHIFAEIEGDTTESSASKISLNGVTGITRHYNMSKEGETTTSFPIYVPSETTPHLQSSTQKENDTENEIFGNRKLEKLVEVNRITGDVSITDEHMKSNASEMKIVFDHKVDKFDKLGEVNRLTVIKIVGGELFNDNERSSSVNPNIATDSSSPSKTKTTEILITSDSPRTESIVKKLSTASSPNTDSSTLKAETKTTEFDIFSQTNPPRITFFPLLPIEQEFLLGEKEPRKIVIDSYSRVSNAIAGVPEVLNTETSTLSLEGLFKNNEPTQPTIATTSSTEPTTSATTTINHNATEGTTIDTTKTASTEAQTLPTLKQLITDNTPLVKIKVLEQDPKLHVKEISFLENPVTIPVRILQEEAESTTARKQESEEPLSIIPLTTVEKVTENNIGSSTANSEASQSKRHALDKSDPAVVYPANPIRVKYELMGGFLRADKSEVS